MLQLQYFCICNNAGSVFNFNDKLSFLVILKAANCNDSWFKFFSLILQINECHKSFTALI